jgi:hypothetical protein
MTTGEELELLAKLRALGAKNVMFGLGMSVLQVEFFPPEPPALEKQRKVEERRSDDTGLTQSESRELFLMDE